ncbi:hypothetical protein [Sporosarcina sp. SAFN-015]|uniref:hypothetical protein n=1 Tax=Sporosarcina sp. SAFN-015 TaxID=3387274 RepID=UPI003F80D728
MFWKKKKAERKSSIDDKVHVQPTISRTLKEQIERLSYIIDQPISKTCDLLFNYGTSEREIVEWFARYFQKDDLRFENSVYRSHADNPSLKDVPLVGPTERISIRFTQDGYHDVDMYADMLGISDSRAVGLVLEKTIKHVGVLQRLIRFQNNRMHFDEITIAEMKKLMKYVNHQNPYKETWNDKFVAFIEGPKKRPKLFSKPITPECVDTETYRWNLD